MNPMDLLIWTVAVAGAWTILCIATTVTYVMLRTVLQRKGDHR